MATARRFNMVNWFQGCYLRMSSRLLEQSTDDEEATWPDHWRYCQLKSLLGIRWKNFSQKLIPSSDIDSESCKTKPNLDCDYTFPIGVASNWVPFSAKSIGKMQLQSKFGLNQQNSEVDSYVFLRMQFCQKGRGRCEKPDMKNSSSYRFF